MADNTLELAIIGGLIAIIVAFITIGSVAVFRQGSKIDRLGEELVKTNRELSEKIAQSHQEISDKIDEKIDQLRDDMIRQAERMKSEIINALVNHAHPEPGGPPVFTAPPPVAEAGPAEQELAPTPADN